MPINHFKFTLFLTFLSFLADFESLYYDNGLIICTDYIFIQTYEYMVIFSHNITGLFLLEIFLWLFENKKKMKNSFCLEHNQSTS